jgi:hypothetical protein
MKTAGSQLRHKPIFAGAWRLSPGGLVLTGRWPIALSFGAPARHSALWRLVEAENGCVWLHFAIENRGFHFAGKCSKTCAATVNRCGS